MRRSVLAAALVLAAAAHAQPSQQQPAEPAAPLPLPALRLEGLVPLEVPRSVGVRWAIDPQSLQVTPDGLVRYVVVGQSGSGALNVYYESLRCATNEVKVHARRGRDGDWVRAGAGEDWRAMDGGAATRHSRAIANSGACFGPMANGSAADIVRALRGASTGRYENQSR